jgi:hypothetical protein
VWVDQNVSDHVEFLASVVIEDPNVSEILTGIIDDGLTII